MLDYVVKITKDATKVWKDDHERLRAAGFDDKAILQVTLIAAWFNYINRVADALGVGRECETGGTSCVGRVSDPPVERSSTAIAPILPETLEPSRLGKARSKTPLHTVLAGAGYAADDLYSLHCFRLGWEPVASAAARDRQSSRAPQSTPRPGGHLHPANIEPRCSRPAGSAPSSPRRSGPCGAPAARETSAATPGRPGGRRGAF